MLRVSVLKRGCCAMAASGKKSDCDAPSVGVGWCGGCVNSGQPSLQAQGFTKTVVIQHNIEHAGYR